MLLILMCANAVLAYAQTNNTKADEKTVAYLKQFRLAYVKSVLDKESGLLTAYYDNNVRLMVEFQKTMMGRDNVMAYHEAFYTRLESKSYTREELEILDLGTFVVEFGIFNLKATLKGTGKEYEIQGKYQNIWKKENEKLLLITEGWNYDHRLDIGDQLRFSKIPVMDVALQAHMPITNNISFELAALNRLVEVTVSEHDAKIWPQFYSDDAIIFAQHHSILKGRNAIDEYYRQHVKELPVFEKLDVRNDRIDDLGNYVIEYASHIAIIRDGDFSGVFTGKDLAIWRRASNGSLKIFRHMGMYD